MGEFKGYLHLLFPMVMAAKQSGDGHDHFSGRYLDPGKVQRALDAAQQHGASYAEVRVVSLTESSVAMRDGVLERAILAKNWA